MLDWELSTLGNQRSDLAYSCLPYIFPSKYRQLYAVPKPLPEGIPTQAEYIQLYSAAFGLPAPPPDRFVFYSAVSLFRAAAIFAGVYRRALQGNASSEHASKTGVLVEALADIALDVIGFSVSGDSGGGVELSHAQQTYSPGTIPGVPTGHFGKGGKGGGEASHALQKYAPGSARGISKQGSRSGAEQTAELSHAQQKYSSGTLPGDPTGRSREGGEDKGELSHALQRYSPSSVQGVPTSSQGGQAPGCHCKGGCGKATLGFEPSEKALALKQKLEVRSKTISVLCTSSFNAMGCRLGNECAHLIEVPYWKTKNSLKWWFF